MGFTKEERAEREKLRIRAVQQILDGKTHASVAQSLKVARPTLTGWVSRYRRGGWKALKARKAKGKARQFKAIHFRRLKNIISKPPSSWDFESPFWTVKMAGSVMKTHYGDNFSWTTILRGLHGLGLSFQKPAVKAFERDPEKVLAWTSREYPRIKKKFGKPKESLFLSTKAEFR